MPIRLVREFQESVFLRSGTFTFAPENLSDFETVDFYAARILLSVPGL